MSFTFLNMARLVAGIFFLGVFSYVHARNCEPPGIVPLPCDEAVCTLPDCACEEAEPDVLLEERPQVSD